jgi:hypothetical protein
MEGVGAKQRRLTKQRFLCVTLSLHPGSQGVSQIAADVCRIAMQLVPDCSAIACLFSAALAPCAMLGPAMASKGRPYRRVLVEGFEVLIGRGAEENDELSFGVAAQSDAWLHVAGGTPGSHVVIRNPDRVVLPKAVVERAASHAAWFSKARNAALVEVHYCQVSDLRKPRGAKAGLVQLKKYKSLRVRPAPPADDPAEAGDDEASEA